MKTKVIFVLFFISILFSCKKDSSSSTSTSSGTVLTIYFKGKTFTIKGNAINPLDIAGVYANTSSENITQDLFVNITGTYSKFSLSGKSSEVFFDLGGTKKADPLGTYSYVLIGTIISSANYGSPAYLGTVNTATTSFVSSPSMLIGLPEIATVLTDYTDGGKKYLLVPSLSTATITTSNATTIAGNFSVTGTYNGVNQLVTGTFTFVK